jgi:hypothetical protein
VQAAAFAKSDLGGDHPPWDRLAAVQFPQPRGGPDDYAEPAAADIPAIDADVDPGQLIAAQVTQVLVMHDVGDGSQVGSGPREPPRGNQYLGRVRTLTMTALARVALDNHLGDRTVVPRVGALKAEDLVRTPSR